MSNDQQQAPYQLLIRDLPQGERPRESALAVAARLLAAFGGLKGLAQAPFGELEMQPALGEAKTAQIKADLCCQKERLVGLPQMTLRARPLPLC